MNQQLSAPIHRSDNHADKLALLRKSLARQGVKLNEPIVIKKPGVSQTTTGTWPQGFPAHLLQQNVLHEIIPARFGDISAFGFCMMALRDMSAKIEPAKINQPMFLWCTTSHQTTENGLLFAPGLKHIGLDPDLIIQLETRRTNDMLWAMEEAARNGALKAIIGFVDKLSFTQSRRLSLVAANGHTIIFIIRPPKFTGSTTAFCRWKTTSQPAMQNLFNPRAPGPPAFKLQLVQSQNGHKGKWICHYEYQTDNMPVVATTGDRTLHSQHTANRQRTG